jgi:hypothetical protein
VAVTNIFVHIIGLWRQHGNGLELDEFCFLVIKMPLSPSYFSDDNAVVLELVSDAGQELTLDTVRSGW